YDHTYKADTVDPPARDSGPWGALRPNAASASTRAAPADPVVAVSVAKYYGCGGAIDAASAAPGRVGILACSECYSPCAGHAHCAAVCRRHHSGRSGRADFYLPFGPTVATVGDLRNAHGRNAVCDGRIDLYFHRLVPDGNLLEHAGALGRCIAGASIENIGAIGAGSSRLLCRIWLGGPIDAVGLICGLGLHRCVRRVAGDLSISATATHDHVLFPRACRALARTAECVGVDD